MRAALACALVAVLFPPGPAARAQDTRPAFPTAKSEPRPGASPGEQQEEKGSQTYKINGRTIDQWIAEIPSKDRSRSEIAIRTVQLFDPELAQRAVPAILKELRKHTGSYVVDTSIRVNGVGALGEILGNAERPDPLYVKEAVKDLTRLLRDTQTLVKYRACVSLARIGPEGAPAVNELIALLRDRSTWETRQVAAVALGMVALDKQNGPNPAVLNALYGALKTDPASRVRLAAIQAFTYLGAPKNPEHQRIVYSALGPVAVQDSDPTVRLWANIAVMNLEGKPDPTRIEAIGKLLEDEDGMVRAQAAQALHAIGQDGRSQVSRLVAALDDEEQAVTLWAMSALGRMGRFADEALPRLQELATGKEHPAVVRQTAQESMDAIQGKAVGKKDAR